MKLLPALIIACMLMWSAPVSQAQIIPAERGVDWWLVPAHHHFVRPTLSVDVHDFGATGDGLTDDSGAIQDAINSLEGRLGEVFLPPGRYRILDPLVLNDSVLLRGTSADSTFIMAQFGDRAVNVINIQKSQSGVFVPILWGALRGSNRLTVDQGAAFSAGDWVEIREQNGDWDVVPIAWADHAVGQVTRITAVSADTLILQSPLRIDYQDTLAPEIRPLDMISNTGVQCLSIKRLDEPVDGAGSNIDFSYAANSVVLGVSSDSSVGSHINVNTSANLRIEGCYFHHAFTYDGTGTRGYGIALSQHTSECLIQNNIFRVLRHAMMVKTGSNGNVFAYNYSREPLRSEPIPDFSGDISLHGHYAYANLFEGNIVQNLIVDHYWGPSGPWNTFFRNREELYGIFMTSSDLTMTDRQNFVGNEVTNTEFLYGMYFLTGTDHFEWANRVRSDTIPAGSGVLTELSCYLDSPPAFWNGEDWPSIGIPNVSGSGTIPAQQRYLEGVPLVICPPDSLVTSICASPPKETWIRCWPNPVDDRMRISGDFTRAQLQLISSDGCQRFSITLHGEEGDVHELLWPPSAPAGFYVLRAVSPGKVPLTIKMIKR